MPKTSVLDALLPKHIKKLLEESRKNPTPPHRLDWLRLHRHENPTGSIGNEADLSRYPDPEALELRQALALHHEINAEQIATGAGSEDLLRACLLAFCSPGKDRVIGLGPVDAYLSKACASLGLRLDEEPLNKYFQIQSLDFKNEGIEVPKLLYLSNPNRVSGVSLRIFDLIDLLDNFSGMVLIDEALIDYSHNKSLLHYVLDYPNLMVLQSFSHAWGLAGARVAALYAQPEVIEVINLVKTPFALSTPAQQVACKALRLPEHKHREAQTLVEQREVLKAALLDFTFVGEVLDSDANFLLVRFARASLMYEYLRNEGILVADVQNQVHCENALRINIGTETENARLLFALNEFKNKTSPTRRFLKNLSNSVRKAGMVLGAFKKIFT